MLTTRGNRGEIVLLRMNSRMWQFWHVRSLDVIIKLKSWPLDQSESTILRVNVTGFFWYLTVNIFSPQILKSVCHNHMVIHRGS